MKHILPIFLAATALCSCGTKQQEVPATKSLIIYYSQTSNTQQVAKLLQEKTGADIDSIALEQPYTGDFGQTITRCQEEMAQGITPAIKPLSHDVAAYDTIYLGYPVWFGTYAPPVAGLLSSVDLSGKVVIPFCTFGSGGNTSIDQLKAKLQNSTIPAWYGVRAARVASAAEEIDEFLAGLKGQFVEAVNFSDQHPLSDTEQAIFDAACGSYQMPLGTPVSVANGVSKRGNEYYFNVESQGQDGQKAESIIHVLQREGAEPEFTQVIR